MKNDNAGRQKRPSGHLATLRVRAKTTPVWAKKRGWRDLKKMNAWGRLHAAMLELSKSAPLKQRLILTFSKHLTDFDAADLPGAMRVEWRAVLGAFEAVPPLRGESAVQATIRKMSNEQAEELAARVVALFALVARARTPRAVQDPAHAEDQGDIPTPIAAEA